MDAVFKALADASRRKLLDALHQDNGQTLTQLCSQLDMTRQAVTKHLRLLEAANLVVTIWHGREKLHYLMLHCHCRDCQRSSGGPFSSFVIVAKEAFKVTQGDPRFHAFPSEAGGMTRRSFCPGCGSPVYALSDSAPGIVALRVASLDDPIWFSPQFDVWTSDAHTWDQMNPTLAKFEKYPLSSD